MIILLSNIQLLLKLFFFSPHFPDFIQWHVHSGDRGRHKVGPDLSWSPGGTTHHALQMGGGTGGLGGPTRSLCIGRRP